MRPHAAHIGCETPAGVAAVTIIGDKARPLFELESTAASGTAADAVHDMRVASRRTREALAGFSQLYDRHERDEALSLIRSVTRALGPVRDADVLLAEFARLCERLDDAEARSALAWLIGYHQRDREVRLKRMRRRLRRLELATRRDAFMRALETTRPGDLADGPLHDLARSVIAERLDAALAHIPAALSEGEAAEQHAMRIAVKHLRYAVETFESCLGEERHALHKHLTRLQDALGELHDRDVFIGLVRDTAETLDPASGCTSLAGIERVAEALAEDRARYFAQFSGLMTDVPTEALRTRVAGAFATGTAVAAAPRADESEPT